jgi:hypothetical protein
MTEDIIGLQRERKYAIYDAIEARRKDGEQVRMAEDPSGFPAVRISVGDDAYLADCLSVEAWYRERNGLRHYIVYSPEHGYGVNAKDRDDAMARVERIVGHAIGTATIMDGDR